MKNKQIWMLWFQGKAAMPEIAQRCYTSWVEQNPDYKLTFLTDENLSDFIQIDKRIAANKNISVQSYADLIRINLLRKYGGVWADATLFCTQPLSNWLDDYASSGFFAFANPGKDRLMSNWFLAADADNYIINTYTDAFEQFWIENPNVRKPNQLPFWRERLFRVVRRLYKSNYQQAAFWFNDLHLKRLKVYPYFVFHYLFEKLYEEDAQFKQAWDSVKKFPSAAPHKLQTIGFDSPLTAELKTEIDNKQVPLYKLSHKIDYNKNSDSVLNYLLRS